MEQHGPAFRSRKTRVTGIGALAAGSALEGGLDVQTLISLVMDSAQQH